MRKAKGAEEITLGPNLGLCRVLRRADDPAESQLATVAPPAGAQPKSHSAPIIAFTRLAIKALLFL